MLFNPVQQNRYNSSKSGFAGIALAWFLFKPTGCSAPTQQPTPNTKSAFRSPGGHGPLALPTSGAGGRLDVLGCFSEQPTASAMYNTTCSSSDMGRQIRGLYYFADAQQTRQANIAA